MKKSEVSVHLSNLKVKTVIIVPTALTLLHNILSKTLFTRVACEAVVSMAKALLQSLFFFIFWDWRIKAAWSIQDESLSDNKIMFSILFYFNKC